MSVAVVTVVVIPVPVAVLMMVVRVVVRMLVMMVVVSVLDRGSLLHAAGKLNPDLHRLDPAAVDGTYRDADLRDSQASRKTFDPGGRSPGPDEGSEKHVAADPGGRVDYGEASV